MIKTLMNKNVSCVQNGGWLSGFFLIERGIKQGCCVSPLLFLLVAELMALKIRNNRHISGFSATNILLKILQYCDDTTLILKDADELRAAIADIEAFNRISGLKLNKSKSVGMWIGRSKHNTSTPGDIQWVKTGESIKVLGIYFNSLQEASKIEKNWTERIEKIKILMKRWQKREMSLYGKIIICKTYLLSQLSYVIQSLSLPNEVLTEIDTLLFKFIWQKTFSEKKAIEKIKRSIICRDIDKGGLNMIKIRDQQRVFLIRWLQKVIDPQTISNLTNSNIPNIYFKEMGGIKYMTSATVSVPDIKLPGVPGFWKDVIKTWLDINANSEATPKNTAKDILQEPLFFNGSVKYKGNPLYFRPWIRAGITHVFHIFENGQILTINRLLTKIRNYGGLYFDYNAMYNAIPVIWKNIISNIDYNNVDIRDVDTGVLTEKQKKIMSLNNKELRKIIGENETASVCGRMFWRRKYDVDILKHFKIAVESTRESRLRLLHYKILHNIFPSNILLHKMKIKNTDNCDYCGAVDYVEHMFIHCPRLRGFWEMIFNMILARTGVRVDRTDSNILFGINRADMDCNKEKYIVINHIILIAKMCISKTKKDNIRNTQITFEIELAAREQFFI